MPLPASFGRTAAVGAATRRTFITPQPRQTQGKIALHAAAFR
jgi:hypothetical protein